MNLLKETYVKYEVEINVIVLALLSFYLWYNTQINWVVSVAIYLIIFIVLLYLKKPISWLIIVTIFSIVAKNKDLSPDYDYFMVSFLFLIVLMKVFKNKRIVFGKLFFILVINLIYSIISLTYTPDLRYGVYGIGGLFEGYMAYFIITNSDIKFNKDTLINISKIASLFLFVITAQIIYQYATHNVDNINGLKNIVRLGWQYSNLIAPFYVLLVPIALYKYTIKNKFYLIYFLLDFLNILGLILTLSRGGYLGLGAGILIFITFNIKNWRMIWRYGLMTIFSCIIILLHSID